MKKYTNFCLTLITVFTMLISVTCLAKASQDTIRVCYYPLENTSGDITTHPYKDYYFDYLQEISQYTGWNYEFVDATYEEALELLAQDELDLICGIDKSAEREALLDFSTAPLMVTKYKFFADITNNNLFYDDYAYFDGMRVGVLTACEQATAIDTLANNYGITLHQIAFSSSNDMEEALLNGEIDMLYATSVSDNTKFKIVAHFSNTQLYFATSKGDSLMTDIIAAQRDISNLFSYFEYSLYQENIEINQDFRPFFTRAELDYIKEHPVVYFGSDPFWAPIEYTDSKTGELAGITAEIINLLESYTGLDFVYKPSATFSEALDKLQYGEVEMLTALSHDYQWASDNNVNLSTSYLDSYIVMIYSNNKKAPEGTVALPRNFNITEQVIAGGDHSEILYYNTTEECIKAVADGLAQCTYTNNYVANYHLSNLAYRNLSTTKISSISEDIAIAVSKNADLRLLSIIDKALRCISTEKIDAIVLNNSLYETELNMRTLLYGYPELIVLLLICFFSIIFLALIATIIFNRRKARAIEAVSQTDALTGILNRGAVQAKITMALEKEKHNPDLVCPLIAIDLDNFKYINDNYGHMEGDRLLIAVANVLKNSVRKSDIVGRLGGDEFIVYLTNVNNKKTAEKVAAKLCTAVSALSLEKDEWSEITGSFGVAFGNPDITWDSLYRHADSALYVAKESGKNQYSIYNDET